MKNKDIAQSFRIEPRIEPVVQKEDLEYNVYKYVEKYICESVDNWENFCIDCLYKEYQKLGVTKVFVINREEFKKFLLWALPRYYNEKEN